MEVLSDSSEGAHWWGVARLQKVKIKRCSLDKKFKCLYLDGYSTVKCFKSLTMHDKRLS